MTKFLEKSERISIGRKNEILFKNAIIAYLFLN